MSNKTTLAHNRQQLSTNIKSSIIREDRRVSAKQCVAAAAAAVLQSFYTIFSFFDNSLCSLSDHETNTLLSGILYYHTIWLVSWKRSATLEFNSKSPSQFLPDLLTTYQSIIVCVSVCSFYARINYGKLKLEEQHLILKRVRSSSSSNNRDNGYNLLVLDFNTNSA